MNIREQNDVLNIFEELLPIVPRTEDDFGCNPRRTGLVASFLKDK